ncbi:hypothetical protein IFM89_016508 [Coptis chinensis]|uniref:60S ribosomal protein L34 n=1 Tax=Coptis chinensis TaxID=261450 RepID=A0A835ID81_9MAGN|nr:hypothetical protein IFM89_016508 [Coptis chinensis]
MVQRLTYRKRHSYATKSNQNRVVKTPGGKLVYQTTKKRASGPKCPVTGKRIQGIPHLRPAEYKRSRKERGTSMAVARAASPSRTIEKLGGKLVYQTTKKRASGPKCPVTGKRIQGIPHRDLLNTRGGAVRERIIRAFLVEEQKIVKKVLKIQKAKEKVKLSKEPRLNRDSLNVTVIPSFSDVGFVECYCEEIEPRFVKASCWSGKGEVSGDSGCFESVEVGSRRSLPIAEAK